MASITIREELEWVWGNELGSKVVDLTQAGKCPPAGCSPKHLRRARTAMVKAQLSILDKAGSKSGLGSIQGARSINRDNKTQDSSLPHLMLHDR